MRLAYYFGILIFVLSCLFVCLQTHAQANYGFPLIQTYSPKQYGADIQNWAIAQRENGLIYIGNRHTILEFDGNAWKKIPLPNKYVVRSLTLDQNNRLYIGGTDEFGYLGVDSLGSSTFISLKHLLPKDFPNFKDVWRIHQLDNRLFFQTRNYIFIYDGQQIDVLEAPYGIIQNSFRIYDTYYIKCIPSQHTQAQHTDVANGLYRYQAESNQLVYTGYHHAERFYDMLPLPNGKVLLTTSKDLFYEYDPKTATTQLLQGHYQKARALLENVIPYSSVYLKDGRLAIGTLKSGLIILDLQTGNIKRFTRKTGLIDNTIYQLFIDQIGNLWLAQEQGISYIRINEPLRVYGLKQGLEGTCISATLFNEQLYAGTATGVYKMDANEQFHPLPGEKGQTWQFFATQQHLFAAQTRSFVSVNQRVTNEIRAEPWTVVPLPHHTNTWLVGSYNDGLSILKSTGNRLKFKHKIAGFRENSRKVVIDFQDNIWVSDKVLGIWKLTLNDALDSVTSIRYFGQEEGLPKSKNNYVYPFQWDGKKVPLVGTNKGFYLFDYEKDTLLPVESFNQLLHPPGNIRNAFAVDEDGNFCFLHRKDFVVMRKLPDGSYEADSLSLAPIRGKSADEIQALGNGVFSITTDAGIYFMDIHKRYQAQHAFQAMIRKVTSKDKLVFGGEQLNNTTHPIFEYRNNTLGFQYAAPFFAASDSIQFQYKLAGFDEEWSRWSSKTFKEYTNIPVGKYTFLVKAKNLYGTESEPASYAFEIAAPWYRTPVAYIAYAFGLIGLIWLGIRMNTYRLQKENERLEGIIQERTSEIQEQKEEIQIQAEEIKSQNEVLTAQKNELERSYESLQLLNTIGKEITQNLSLATVVETVYERLQGLLDTTEFGIGIFDEAQQQLVFKSYFLRDQVQPEFKLSTDNHHRLAVHCLLYNQEIWLNNIPKNYMQYIDSLAAYDEKELLNSIICLPLISGQTKIGIMSVQSEHLNAYSEYQVSLLRNIATYTAIAIENARSYEKIIALDQFKESMTGMIVHDLKNPLNAIIGLSTGAPSKQKSTTIHQSGQLMLNLVSNILDVYKFEQTEIELSLNHYALHRLIQLAQQQVAFLSAEKSIKFIHHIPPTIGVRVDAEIVERILINLFTNAIKYTPSGGTVTIHAEITQEFVSISVTDTGTGIPADKIAFIFDKFGQAEARKSGQARSTGLGLTFCKMAVEAHGGQIQATSEEGKGATFTFTLPKGKTLNQTQAETELPETVLPIQLSKQERAKAQPFEQELRVVKIYEISKINSILRQVDAAPTSALEEWKIALKSASLYNNEAQFKRLLDLVSES